MRDLGELIPLGRSQAVCAALYLTNSLTLGVPLNSGYRRSLPPIVGSLQGPGPEGLRSAEAIPVYVEGRWRDSDREGWVSPGAWLTLGRGPPEGTGSEWTKVLLMRQPWPEARTRSRCLGERSLISAAACRPRVLPAAEEASFTPVLGWPQDTRPQGRAGQHTHQRTHEAAEAENCTAAGKMHA